MFSFLISSVFQFEGFLLFSADLVNVSMLCGDVTLMFLNTLLAIVRLMQKTPNACGKST